MLGIRKTREKNHGKIRKTWTNLLKHRKKIRNTGKTWRKYATMENNMDTTVPRLQRYRTLLGKITTSTLANQVFGFLMEVPQVIIQSSRMTIIGLPMMTWGSPKPRKPRIPKLRMAEIAVDQATGRCLHHTFLPQGTSMLDISDWANCTSPNPTNCKAFIISELPLKSPQKK